MRCWCMPTQALKHCNTFRCKRHPNAVTSYAAQWLRCQAACGTSVACLFEKLVLLEELEFVHTSMLRNAHTLQSHMASARAAVLTFCVCFV